ncbi:hypothetical protein [Gordonia zhaorongruii]|uniref:hypothetical protein n=1 Tax=Gordonia zhaorongruii TaxID=2597659 RepID=UPI0011815D89|nr:hypothetical protein [Gordonia zhaorongruii]
MNMRTVRTRIAAVGAATVLASTGALVLAPQADAQPDTQDMVHQVASAPYSWLFSTGLQVYELVEKRPVESLSPPADEFVMRKLHGPNDGRAGSARYVYLGRTLPEAFSVAGAHEVPDRQAGALGPLDPKTLELDPDDNAALMIWQVAGRIGEVNGIGVVTPYLG